MPGKAHLPPQRQDTQPGRESEMVPLPEEDDPGYRGSGKLADKIAIITGADSGIGKAVAIAFAKEVADVAILYYDEHEDAEKTEREVERLGRRCIRVAGTSRMSSRTSWGIRGKIICLETSRYAIKAGITDADKHSLRHTFCTQLARKNVPVQKIMKLAGHLDIETTMIYVNLVKEDLRDSVDKLDFGLGFSELRQNCGTGSENVIKGDFSKP